MKRRIWLPLAGLTLAALACSLLRPGGATPTATAVTAIQAATDAATASEPPPTATAAAASTETPAAPGTPEAGDRTLIAYVRDGQLLVTDVTGGVLGGTTQYTQPGMADGVTDLAWSPSGEYIAYTGVAGDEQHVFVVYAEGAGTPVDLGAGAIAGWSPDSTQVAYQRLGQIWLTAIDAPAPRPLTAQDNWAWGRPAFMPDGLSLAVTGAPFDSLGASGNTSFFIYSLPLDGSGTLTPLPGMTDPIDGRLPYDLRFAPDGSRLAFSTSFHLNACAAPGSYFVGNNDGSGLRTVESPSLAAVAATGAESYVSAYGYDWRPDSAGLLLSGLVRDCADFAGTVLAAQMSFVGLDGAEATIVSGAFGPVSVDDDGTYIAATFEDGSATGQVRLYDTTGALLVEVGPGSLAQIQP